MPSRSDWLLLCAFALCACNGDADQDGLSDSREAQLGTDPQNSDSDGDGLLDGDEVDRGLDPTNADTDGDGYRDGDELFEATDPADPNSRIYQGGWPYLRNKESIPDPGYTGQNRAGEPSPRMHALDQYGDTVDLADSALKGNEILIEICGTSWAVCAQLAEYRESDGQVNPFMGVPGALEKLATEQGFWITVLTEGPVRGEPSTYDDVTAWHAAYGLTIPVLWDADQLFRTWAAQGRENPALPKYVLLNEDLSIRLVEDDDSPTAYGLAVFGDEL